MVGFVCGSLTRDVLQSAFSTMRHPSLIVRCSQLIVDRAKFHIVKLCVLPDNATMVVTVGAKPIAILLNSCLSTSVKSSKVLVKYLSLCFVDKAGMM